MRMLKENPEAAIVVFILIVINLAAQIQGV